MFSYQRGGIENSEQEGYTLLRPGGAITSGPNVSHRQKACASHSVLASAKLKLRWRNRYEKSIIGCGATESFHYPIYGGMILLAGLIIGCTILVLEEIKSLKKRLQNLRVMILKKNHIFQFPIAPTIYKAVHRSVTTKSGRPILKGGMPYGEKKYSGTDR